MKIKKWSEMTFKEIKRLKQGQCSKCYYFSKAQGDNVSGGTCDYLAVEGHSRGCSPLECKDKNIFRIKTKKGRRRALG